MGEGARSVTFHPSDPPGSSLGLAQPSAPLPPRVLCGGGRGERGTTGKCYYSIFSHQDTTSWGGPGHPEQTTGEVSGAPAQV